ncbi:hypothetical protein LTR97_005941 [Elasticomyces elasticus]|uniref:Uncharacterized protein n=1 Tax=Elasticomyces elasticus TaxID=574655 RepID=A0AAN7W477_9PEZI|nr:hypothetical protein LTR97_005941 [Elasticomyces elasticus]
MVYALRQILKSSLADNGCFPCDVSVSLQFIFNHTTEVYAAAPYPNGDVEFLSKSSQLPKPAALTPIGRSMVSSKQLHVCPKLSRERCPHTIRSVTSSGESQGQYQRAGYDVKKLPDYTKKIEKGLAGMDGFGGRVANLEAIYGD